MPQRAQPERPRMPTILYNGPVMVKKLRLHAADLRGVNQLTIDGIAGIVDLVEGPA